MKKYIKVEALIIIASIGVSLLAFWIEPSISNVSKGSGTTVTTVGWPFAIQKTTAGTDVSYVGPYTSNSTAGLVYDWLLLLAVTLVVLNLGWWVAKAAKKKPEATVEDPE